MSKEYVNDRVDVLDGEINKGDTVYQPTQARKEIKWD